MKMGYQAVLYWHFNERKRRGKVKLKSGTDWSSPTCVCWVGAASKVRAYYYKGTVEALESIS